MNKERGNPDTPIPRYPDTPVLRFPNSKRGVTLVELLVAVALLSLIMVAFYTIFKGGTKAYETGETRVELIQNARIALDRISSEIRQALPDPYDFKIYKETGVTVSAGSFGQIIFFYAPIDDKSSDTNTYGAEEIRFSQLYCSHSPSCNGANDTHKNLVYKRVKNPDQNYGNQEVTTEVLANLQTGVDRENSGITFCEEPPAVTGVRSGLITIKLILKEDPSDSDSPEYIIQTKVKAPRQYGIGLKTSI